MRAGDAERPAPPARPRLGPALVAWSVRTLGLTLSIRRDERAVEPLWLAGAPVIYAVWHGRVLLLPLLYGRRPLRVLASRSRDGELVTRYVGRFGIESVRGSSSRGGAERSASSRDGSRRGGRSWSCRTGRADPRRW